MKFAEEIHFVVVVCVAAAAAFLGYVRTRELLKREHSLLRCVWLPRDDVPKHSVRAQKPLNESIVCCFCVAVLL